MPYLLLVSVAIAFLAIVFAVQNASVVLVSFFLWEFESSLALVLLLTFAVGAVTGMTVLLPRLVRQRLEIKNQRKEMEQLQKAGRTAPPGPEPLPPAGTP